MHLSVKEDQTIVGKQQMIHPWWSEAHAYATIYKIATEVIHQGGETFRTN